MIKVIQAFQERSLYYPKVKHDVNQVKALRRCKRNCGLPFTNKVGEKLLVFNTSKALKNKFRKGNGEKGQM